MNCTVHYTEDKELNVLIRTFSGTVTVEDIINSWKHLFNSAMLDKNYLGVISDYIGTNFQIEKNDFYMFRDFFSENDHILGKLKLVQVIDSPKIVLPMLWKLDYDRVQSATFSTLDEAKRWIISPKSKNNSLEPF